MEYVIKLVKEDGNYLVNFPDIEWVHTHGETLEEAKTNAIDALETALESCIEDRTAFPVPRKAKKGDLTVKLSAQASAKAALHNEMIHQKVRKSDLARKLKLHLPQIDRLLNIHHSTKLESLEEAFNALGKTINIEIKAVSNS